MERADNFDNFLWFFQFEFDNFPLEYPQALTNAAELFKFVLIKSKILLESEQSEHQ